MMLMPAFSSISTVTGPANTLPRHVKVRCVYEEQDQLQCAKTTVEG